MKPLITAVRCLATAALMVGSISAANASLILDFEDVPPSFVPSSYHGFAFSGGSGGISWVVRSEAGNLFPGIEAHSQTQFAWSNGAVDLSISGVTPFDFNSLWARIGNLTSGIAIAHGFLGATELYTQTLNLTDSHQLFTLNFIGIDSWTLTDQSNNTLIDDITLNDVVTGSVPEPMTLSLLGAGLAGIGMARRRKA